MAKPFAYRGFTLVELVVTLVIIGALAAVSAPIFFSKQSFEQHGFFNELLSAVRYAQKLAVASGCTTQVSLSGTSYTIYRDDNIDSNCNNGPYATAVTDPSNLGNTFTRNVPPASGISISAVPVTVFNFAPLGNSTADVTVTVNPGNRQFRVWAATGYVERL